MFITKTLFILGAGASVPYGYPVGQDLIKYILDDMEDIILIPTYRKDNSPPYWNKFDEANNYYYEYELIQESIRHISNTIDSINESSLHINDVNSINISDCRYTDEGSNKYQIIQIGRIDIFHQLRQALNQHNVISIDTFLRDNPSHQIAGKTMILYSLLKRERLDKINRSDSDDWYSVLFNDLISDCEDNPQKILNNQIDFITFNYDVSLDYYLGNKMASTEIYNSVSEQFKNNLPIEHVYGKTHCHNDISYGKYSDQEDLPKRAPFPSTIPLNVRNYPPNCHQIS